MGKKILIGLVVVLVVLQFIRPTRNESAGVSASDITTAYTVPEDVQAILKKACYDCHSNNTRYPWYTNIQPVGLWMQRHVNEGKGELNFSEFASYKPKRQAHKMKELAEQVQEGEMPLGSYTWIHKDAILTDAEKQTLVNWAHQLEAQITPLITQ